MHKGDSMKQVKFNMEDDAHAVAKAAAKRLGLSLAAFIRMAAIEKAEAGR